MYNPDIKKIEVEQKSKEWLGLRENYITASDIPAILTFKTGNNYYNRTPSMWVEKKLGAKESFSTFSRDLMTAGELSEEKIVEQHFSNKELYSHGDVYTRDVFLASLDVVDKKNSKIIELKYTPSEKVYNQYADYSHPAYMQVAFQMYVAGISQAAILVNFNLNGKSILKAFNITCESEQYKNIVDNIDYIKNVHTEVIINRENPFLEKASNKFQSLIDAIEGREKKIKELKEELEIYKEQLVKNLEQGKLISAFIGDTEYKYTLQPSIRTKKTLKEGIKEEDVYDIEKVESIRISKTKA